MGRISPLAFFEAGDSCYKNERFYWQNADKTLTLVGIGHATVLTSEGTGNRFAQISAEWNKLRAALIKEENDIEPVLSEGFRLIRKTRRNPNGMYFRPLILSYHPSS